MCGGEVPNVTAHFYDCDWLQRAPGMIETRDFQKVCLISKFIILAYRLFFPVYWSLILCYQLVKNGTGGTGTETSRSRPVGCLDFWSNLKGATKRVSHFINNSTEICFEQKHIFMPEKRYIYTAERLKQQRILILKILLKIFAHITFSELPSISLFKYCIKMCCSITLIV